MSFNIIPLSYHLQFFQSLFVLVAKIHLAQLKMLLYADSKSYLLILKTFERISNPVKSKMSICYTIISH